MVSFQPTQNQKDMHQSRLGFVFYCGIVVSIEEIFNQISNHVDWENHAENLSYDNY
jgi:hypothetical protein